MFGNVHMALFLVKIKTGDCLFLKKRLCQAEVAPAGSHILLSP